MRRRSIMIFRPAGEQLEEVRLLSANLLTAHAAATMTDQKAAAVNTDARRTHTPLTFLGFRVTNPSAKIRYKLVPPFQQVLVQATPPVPGQVYNVLQIAVRNGTAQTFTASSGFTVRLNTEKQTFPILTGTQEWKPKQVIVFYILTKNYYLLPQTYGGFQFNLGGRSSTLVPGPSAIFLRLKYNPATFANTLNWIVAFGQGDQVGKGAFFGIPNTSINNIVAGITRRNDIGGHF
jgi:hypothetical protein